jgi:hypothetical protein
MTDSVQSETRSMTDRLADPFPTTVVQWLPKSKQPNSQGRVAAVPYVDVHAVKDRLDHVLGEAGWYTRLRPIADGVLRCRLVCSIDGNWIAKESIGSATKDDLGQSFKAAEADAIKRAAALFGVARYLAFLPRAWLLFDTERKVITERPELPDWACPGGSGRPPVSIVAAKPSAALRDELSRLFHSAGSMPAIGAIRLAVKYAVAHGKLRPSDLDHVATVDANAVARVQTAQQAGQPK